MRNFFFGLLFCLIPLSANATCSASGSPTDTLCQGTAISDYSTTPAGLKLSAAGPHGLNYGPGGWVSLFSNGSAYYTWTPAEVGGWLYLNNTCNLLYQTAPEPLHQFRTTIWQSGTSATICHLTLQSNGDLVLWQDFQEQGKQSVMIWHTNTAGY